jgi:hypothetical protein
VEGLSRAIVKSPCCAFNVEGINKAGNSNKDNR